MKQGIMLVGNEIGMEKVVKAIIVDLKRDGITNFGEWLTRYDDTIFEVEQFVNDYCTKVNEDRLNEIEQWQKVVMMNALALYMIEWDTDQIPTGMMNRILRIYVETIRNYSLMKKGNLKLYGTVFISDISLCRFSKVNES